MTPIKWIIAAIIATVALGGLYFVTKDGSSVPISNTYSSTESKNEQPLKPPTVDTTKTYTAAEVAQHKTKQDCWTIINGKVYDLTSYVVRHEGGDEILRACGIDASSLFNRRETSDGKEIGSGTPHSSQAEDSLKTLQVGVLAN